MHGGRIFRSRSGVAAAAAALTLVAAGGAAYAAGASQQHASGPRGAIAAAIASDLGISASTLRADLASGQTLAQIAAGSGQPLAGLEQAILATAQSRLDKAAAAGKLTSPEEQVLLGRVNSRLGQLVNVSHPGQLVRRALGRAAFTRFSAGYLGITPAQLRSDLGSGSTLAQIAATNGKTSAGLEQAIESAVTTRLDRAAAAGLITSQREQTMLAKLQARLDTLVDRNFAA